MKKLLIILFVLIIGFCLYWGWKNKQEDIAVKDLPVAEDVQGVRRSGELRGQTPEITERISPISIMDALPPLPSPSSVPSPESDIVGELSEEGVVSEEQIKRIEAEQHTAREWIVMYRKLMGGVMRLWSIDQGNASAMVAEAVDIHELHAELTETLESIAVEDEEVINALHVLNGAMSSIVEGLSDPPTSTELASAKQTIDEINPALQQAYSTIEQLQ